MRIQIDLDEKTLKAIQKKADAQKQTRKAFIELL